MCYDGKGDFGTEGRNVVLDKSFGAPRITKDGVTVAKEIELSDKLENMGAQMKVKSQVRLTTKRRRYNDSDAFGAVDCPGRLKGGCYGMNPMDLKRGIDLAVDAARCEPIETVEG